MTEELGTVELRDAQPNDLPFLFSLYCDVRAPELAAWGWPAVQQDAFLRMQFEAQRQSYLSAYPESIHHIVSAAGVPMGRRLIARTPDGIHLVDIALLAAYRNRGIGVRLIGELLDECIRNEYALNLHVLRGNPAIGLYRRLGFQEIGADPMYIEMSWVAGTRRPASSATAHRCVRIQQQEENCMAELLRSRDFAAHLHTVFRVETPVALELELTEVNERSNDKVEQFSVFFQGPASPWLRQGMHMLQHAQMQRVDLFLVPLGPREGRMVYEAVFARLLTSAH